MRKKIEWQWENLDDSTSRAKVIGGWVIKSEYSIGKSKATTLQFVADRDHEWHISKPIQSESPKVKSEDFEPK